MKIIHVLSGLTKGGGERVVVELSNKAVENGDNVTIIAGWPVDPIYMQNDIDSKIDVKFIAQTKVLAYLKMIFWIVKNKKWLYSQDVLHCHLTYGAMFGSATGILLRNFFREKTPMIVETNHAVGMPVPKFNRWVNSRMALLRNGLVFMAKDPYWKNFAAKHPNLNTEIIPNGIAAIKAKRSEELIQNLRKELAIPDSCKYLVGTVGMLRPDRKPWLYIPIFKNVHQVLGNDVHFILAGGGIEFDNVKALIENEGLLDYVSTPGLINKPIDYISNMDVYVSLCVGETTGISMIEAAMCNVPVVGIQLTENYQSKNEDWVWSDANSVKVAEKIVLLLQNREVRNETAEKQNKYVNAHFTSDAMYSAYDSFYKRILSK